MISDTPKRGTGNLKEQVDELYRALDILRGEAEYELGVLGDRIAALEGLEKEREKK